MNNKTIHEGKLVILSRGAYHSQAINPKKTTPNTTIKIVRNNKPYIAEIFKNIPQEFEGRRVALEEYRDERKSIIKDILYVEGRVFPIVSRRKYRENNFLV